MTRQHSCNGVFCISVNATIYFTHLTSLPHRKTREPTYSVPELHLRSFLFYIVFFRGVFIFKKSVTVSKKALRFFSVPWCFHVWKNVTTSKITWRFFIVPSWYHIYFFTKIPWRHIYFHALPDRRAQWSAWKPKKITRCARNQMTPWNCDIRIEFHQEDAMGQEHRPVTKWTYSVFAWRRTSKFQNKNRVRQGSCGNCWVAKTDSAWMSRWQVFVQ